MSDIVERLREVAMEKHQAAWGRIDGGQDLSIGAMLADEAADEIERLQAELRAARELLDHIDAQLPSWLDAMSDWELGGDMALESMDGARARIDAFLAK